MAQVEKHFNDQEDRAIPQRLQLLCAAAAFATARGRRERGGARNEAFAAAQGLLGQARALDHSDATPYLAAAQLALAKVRTRWASGRGLRSGRTMPGARWTAAP